MDITLFLIIFVGILVLFFVLFLWTLNRIKRAQSEDKALSLMQDRIGQLDERITQQLERMSGQFRDTTGHIGNTLGDVKKNLGRMEVVTREVLEKARDISSLESLLRAPKFRGGLGELFLGDLLAQILPPAHFSLQHRFKSGETVDAIIRIGKNIVPIDSKFPLENFKKLLEKEDDKEKQSLRKQFISDVKKHIDEIAKKYILPDEGTYDFALMYIPAENIYYETILKEEGFGEEKSIFSFAIQKRVIPVSPNSFFAYLQVIVLGLKGLQIEKSALSIFQSLTQLQGDLDRFKKDFQKIGSHLSHARIRFDEADKRLDKFSDRLELFSAEGVKELPKKAEDE